MSALQARRVAQLVSGMGSGRVAHRAGASLSRPSTRCMVAGYLYVHHRSSPVTPVPVVPGQYGIYGHLLLPYSRDFFTVLSN